MAIYEIEGQRFEIDDSVQGAQLEEALIQLSETVLSEDGARSNPNDDSGFLSNAAEFGRRALDETVGAFETPLTIATAAIAEPVAGIAGLVSAPFTDDFGVGAINRTRELLTLKPQTKRGERQLNTLGQAVEPIFQGVDSVVSAVADPVSENVSPAAGAAVKTIPVALAEFFALRGIKGARGAQQLKDAPPEVIQELSSQGVNVNNVTDSDVLAANQILNSQTKERQDRFKRLGVDATVGDLTQDSGLKAQEARALENTEALGRQELIKRRIDQSDQLRSNLEELQAQLGEADNVGDSIKDSAKSLDDDLRVKKNQLYKKFAEESDSLSDIPVDSELLSKVVPDSSEFDIAARQVGDEAVSRLENVLVEFGLIDDPELVSNYLKGTDRRGKPRQIKQLTAQNHDQFRQSLSDFDDPRVNRLAAPIKKALDEEVSFLFNAVENSGESDRLGALISEARGTVRDQKTTFNEKRLAGQLIGKKRNGYDPIIEASKVFDKISSKSVPVEDVSRLIDVFNRSGQKGAKAKGDLQAKVVFSLIDGAFGSKSRALNGNQLISRSGFDQAINKIGQDKINVIFDGDKQSLKRISDISKTLDDITPSSFEIPKGSAAVILESLDKFANKAFLNRLPSVQIMINLGQEILDKGQDAKTIKTALNGKPQAKKLATRRLDALKSQAPNLYAALGVGALLSGSSENDGDISNE